MILLLLATAWGQDWAFDASTHWSVPDRIELDVTPVTPVTPTCSPVPTLDACADPAWQASACGAADAAAATPRCPALLAVGNEAWASGSGASLVPLLSPDNVAELDGFAVADAGRARWSGGNVSMLGTLGHAAATDSTAYALLYDPQISEWESNCVIESCEEYVYEAFRDYSRFERLAAQRATARGVVDLAYGAEGISARTLESHHGDPLPDFVFEQRRNHGFYYFTFHEDEINPASPAWVYAWVEGGFGVTYSDALKAEILDDCGFDVLTMTMACQGGVSSGVQQALVDANTWLVSFPSGPLSAIEASYTGSGRAELVPPTDQDPWAWHQATGTALAGFGDDKLNWLQLQQEAYATAMRVRVDRLTAVGALGRQLVRDREGWTDLSSAEVARLRSELRRASLAAREAEARVVALLETADANGCFGPAPTPCDWSPRWLSQSVMGKYQEERSEAFQACIRATGNDFGKLVDADPSDDEPVPLLARADRMGLGDFCVDEQGQDRPGCRRLSNYARSARAVDTYIATVDAFLDALQLPVDPETGAPYLGRASSDRGTLGKSGFGVDWAYDVEWRVLDLGEEACEEGFEAQSAASVDLKAFGSNLGQGLAGSPFGELDSTAVVDDEHHEVSVRFSALGMDLYPGSRGTGVFAPDGGVVNVLTEPVETLDPNPALGTRYEKVFMVGWVPFEVDAGASGSVGLRVDVGSSLGTCTAEGWEVALDAEVRPFLRADAYARLTAGVPGVRLGVRTDLTLVDLGLPLQTHLELSPSEDTLVGDSELALDAAFLKGRISFVAELLLKTFKRTLFRWEGASWSTEAFASNFDFALQEVRGWLGTAEPGEPPAPSTSFDTYRTCASPAVIPAPDLHHDFDDVHYDAGSGTLSPVGGVGDFVLGSDASFVLGMRGTGVGLTGAGPALTATDTSATFGTQGATVFLAVRPTQRDPMSLVELWGPVSGEAIRIEQTAEGYPRAVVRCGQMIQAVQGSRRLPLDTWSTVAFVHDADTGRAVFYVDGAFAGREAVCTPTMSDHTVRVGDGSGAAMTGAVDALGVWDRPLAADQVRELADRLAEGVALHGEGDARLQGPTALSVQAGNGAATLTWQDPPSLLNPSFGYDRVSLHAQKDSPVLSSQPATELAYSVPGTHEHTGLQDGERWFYTLYAHAAGVPPTRGPTVSFTAVLQPPDAPTQVSARQLGSAVQVTWSLPHGEGVGGAVVLRKTTGCPTGPTDGRVVARQATPRVLDGGVVEGKTYHYAVFAFDRNGNHGPGACASVSVEDDPVPVGVPASPVNAVWSPEIGGGVRLSWTHPDPSAIDHTLVAWQRDVRGTPEVVEVEDTTWTTSMGQDTHRAFVLVAVSRNGQQSAPVSLVVDTVLGSVARIADPTTQSTLAGIEVSWSPGSPAASEVEVYVSRYAAFSSPYGSAVASVSSGPVTVPASVEGETVHLLLVPRDAQGVAGEGVAITTTWDPPPPPDAPASLSAVVTESTVELSWDELPGVDSYRLARSLDVPPTGLGTAVSGGAFTDTQVSDDQVWHYALYAVDAIGRASAPARQAVRTSYIGCPDGQAEVDGLCEPVFARVVMADGEMRCALDTAGGLWCSQVVLPDALRGVRVKDLSMRHQSMCVLATDDTVTCFQGANGVLLGTLPFSDAATPLKRIASATQGACVVDASDKLWCATYGSTVFPSGWDDGSLEVVDIASETLDVHNPARVCVLDTEGAMLCDVGLGTPWTYLDDPGVPPLVELVGTRFAKDAAGHLYWTVSPGGVPALWPDATFTMATSANDNLCALDDTQAWRCMGPDPDADSLFVEVPTDVVDVALTEVFQAMGGCWVTSGGRLDCANDHLTLPSLAIPSRLPSLSSFAMDELNLCGVGMADGGLACTQTFSDGQTDAPISPPSDLGPVDAVRMARYLACGHETGADLWRCWGTLSSTGSAVSLDLAGIGMLAASGHGVCGIEEATGTMSCWGHRLPATGPTDLGVAMDVAVAHTSLSSSGYACAWFDGYGRWRCWGESSNPTFGSALFPQAPFDYPGRPEIGSGYGCGVDGQGDLVCYPEGYNDRWAVPEPPSDAYVALSASANTWMCAVSASGAVACWGFEDGDDAVPADVTDIVQVDLHEDEACALDETGNVLCWERGSDALLVPRWRSAPRRIIPGQGGAQ